MPLNINLQQILLHLLNVTILFMALYFLLYKHVKAYMDKRRACYDDMEAKAKETVEAAQKEKEEYDALIEEAKGQAQEIREQAEKDAKARADEIIAAANKEADKIKEKARTDAMKEHDRLIEDAQEDISEMVTHAVEEIVFDDSSEAFEEFLNSIEGEQNGEE